MNRIFAAMGSLIAFVHPVVALSGTDKEESLRTEAAQIELWDKKLQETRGKSAEEKLLELRLGLQNMGYRKTRPDHSPAVDVIFNRLQAELLSIPGHAEFYAKPIRESYTAYRDTKHPEHSGSANRYFDEMRYTMPTPKHLPSAETVNVLGDMLWEEWELEPSPDSDVVPPRSLAKYAVTTMTFLNIRDAPSPQIDPYATPTVLADWQAWYEQIKSGQRTFSFKGQALEYRFKPDGTWDTIPIANPPDDAPEIQEARPAAGQPVAQQAKEEPPGNAGKAYRPYILAALAALLALAAVWFGFRRTKAGT